ncbi:Salicylate hydroxylase [Cyphellophora attinorum]|uniref:Salicylate hydroxylase n=1 Tax=Cyphellophora attinorum TaxID=1664694 RepID=A0A0N1HDB0_9EURO|nr:Salicylate hydroxylase [Phialophora attinorum]KPI42934.1 Salicylate hydroxylase [Phialophora attinorum]
MSKPPFRVAIVGGGLGGLFCALSLHHHVKHPLQIDVYEQAAQYREIGAGIGLGPNAAKLFHEVGLGERINAISGDRAGVWISFRRFDTGEDVITIPSIDKGAVRNVPMARSELLDLLLDAIRERKAATLHTAKRCSKLSEPGADTVTLHFNDDTTATANLVIAADGIHSAVRSQFATDKPVYGGMIAYRGVIPISTLPDPWPFSSYSVAWMGKKRHFLIFPISANKSLNIVAFATKSEDEITDTLESWTATCPRSEVEKDFAGFEGTVQHIIAQMPDPASKWRLNYREPLAEWVHMAGKVVLIGDASHSMMPHQGAGAGQATEDDYVLARCLNEYLSQSSESVNGKGKHASLQEWMQIYQNVRLPRAQKVARTSKEAGEVYEMVTPDLVDKDFEDCLPIVKEKISTRMRWIWTEDIGEAFDKARQELQGSEL